MGGNRGVWRDVTVKEGSWKEVAKSYGLDEHQTRSMDPERLVPHVVEGKDFLFIMLAVPVRQKTEVTEQWLTLYVDAEKTVTFHGETLGILPVLEERIAARTTLNTIPTGVLSIIADVVTEQFTPILDYVDDKVDELEDTMVTRPSDKQLQALFQYKRLLADLRRVALPTIAVLDGLQDGRYHLLDEHIAGTYLRDSYSYAWRAHELIDTMRDLLTSALDTYLSVVSNRLNDVMKRLTMVATIFMPISFLVGFGGMNFVDEIPFGSNVFFAGLMTAIVVTPLSMVLYFRRKKWL